MLEDICREAAEAIHGCKAFPGGGLRFERHGFEARVEFTPGIMDILFDTRDLAVESIQVAPAGFWHDVKDIFGFKDVQIGDRDFNESFEIRTSAIDFVRKVLSPELRPQLRMARLFGKFLWRLSRAGFLLRFYRWPESRVELDRRLMLSFQLLEGLPGSDGKGQIRIGTAVVRMDEETFCQICGVTLAQGKVVRCVKCVTPHHLDCWEFNGRCSIFACGESSFR
jgi:hypothetical protein